MKKRIKALFMALVLMLTSVITLSNNVVEAKADSTLSLVFHFTGGTSPEYYMWIWTIGDGVDVAMTKNGDEWTATLDANSNPAINSSTTVVNYIVKNGMGWNDVVKDVDADRKIDMSKYVSGQVDVYIESGVSKPTVDDSKAVKGFKLTSASTQDCKVITVEAGAEVEGDLNSFFKVKDTANNTYVEIESVALKDKAEDGSCTYEITVKDKLDVTGSYQLEYGSGMEFMIGMPDYYGTDEFESAYTYTGNDLGATYSKASTTFKVWAPTASAVRVNLYKSGTEGTDDKLDTVNMTSDVNGTWVATVAGDLNGVYYTYSADINGNTDDDIMDPYARTAGVNGRRAMVIDLASTNPEGWDSDKNPNPNKNYVDDVLYELHIRDFSIDASSGMKNKGKYLAFTETGTVNSFGQSTGVDYLKKLGVTHIHLLPTFDYASVDETKLDKPQFNWGYDPQNFNMPEGSYSTDPYNGEVRVKEFKQMVQSLHNAGMSVVMDVVYGHVANAGDFSMNRLTPNYYSRPNSSASGCGNDTATERSMNRKFIVDSFIFWATEYHIDGFRIDQQGLFDIDTINEVVEKLHAIDPSIIIYGEGWNMNSTNITKPGLALSNQSAACDTIGAAYFSDSIRDGIKGSVFDETPGYITGGFARLTDVINAVIANPGWQWDPNSVVNYNSCHDNYSLFDRILITDGNEEASFEEHVKQNNLAAAIVYTSQGIPFMQAGEEILRTKPLGDGNYEHNSYCSSDAINSIKWDTLNEAAYQKTFDYYKGLIEFRKAHAGLRMATEKEINDNLTFLLKGEREDSAIAYMIKGGANGESSDGIVVIYNPSTSATKVDLPEGEWGIYVQDDKAGNELLGTATGSVTVNASTATVLVKNNRANGATNTGNDAAKDDNAGIVQTGDSSTAMMLMVVVALGFAVVAVIAMKKKNELN